MKQKGTILLVMLTFVPFLWGSGGNPAGSDGSPVIHRVLLTDTEQVLFEYILDRISQNGMVPSQDELETTFAHSVEDGTRAKLSAKLYYEHGVIGALLSDLETETLQLLLQHRRSFGSLGEMADRIRREFPQSLSTLQALQTLEFLYIAGYIDVRDEGRHVYFILPQGVKTLYFPSSIRQETSPVDPFEKAMANLPGIHREKQSVVPIIVDAPDRSPDSQNTGSLPQISPPPLHPPDIQLVPSEALTEPRDESKTQSEIQEDTAEHSSSEPSAIHELTSPEPSAQETQTPNETNPYDLPEPVAIVASPYPIGPPIPSDRSTQREEKQGEKTFTGFSSEIMKAREKILQPCAPDFWGWPYLYGQDNLEILAYTTDTGTEVRLTIQNGTLISYTPSDIIVFNEGQHGDIRFFRSQQGLSVWQRDFPDIPGQIMTLPEAITWARDILQNHSK